MNNLKTEARKTPYSRCVAVVLIAIVAGLFHLLTDYSLYYFYG